MAWAELTADGRPIALFGGFFLRILFEDSFELTFGIAEGFLKDLRRCC